MSIFSTILDMPDPHEPGDPGPFLRYDGSHLYPDPAKPAQRAVMEAASIGAWCAPGFADGDDEDGPQAPYLRFSLNFLDEQGLIQGPDDTTAVILTRRHVEVMVDALSRWDCQHRDPAT